MAVPLPWRPLGILRRDETTFKIKENLLPEILVYSV
uniref:Uncharacterized protein n=1 Tax=Utricularia reniformis TaxID=192314 RepID=A0A1Y0B2B7_9LAMI|nr:hypothetical protein AEK19_MT1390 [Utricularia reniformis]ART31586.1 hypothetical protein AEK19_MT1390 [Utricularia reniformis]